MTSGATPEERIWQVRLPDGSIWIPVDARPEDPRASWIYARSTADMFADELGGTVIEVTRRQHEKVLDREIDTALAQTKVPKAKAPKTRTRPLGRDARRAIAIAIRENIPLNNAARAAVDTARETADDTEYNRALRALKAGLPPTLWVGYDGHGWVSEVEPLWITENPKEGEDPKKWQQIDRDAVAHMLVEDV